MWGWGTKTCDKACVQRLKMVFRNRGWEKLYQIKKGLNTKINKCTLDFHCHSVKLRLGLVTLILIQSSLEKAQVQVEIASFYGLKLYNQINIISKKVSVE